MNDSKRFGASEATNAGAPPVLRRLPSTLSRVPTEKIEPDASATPAVPRTCASVCSVIGEIGTRLLPNGLLGVITTSWPRFAVWKMPANVWLMVSVRM